MFKSHQKAALFMQVPPVALQDSTNYLWDDEDSLEKLDEAINGNITASTNKLEELPTHPPTHPAGTYSKSTNDSGLRFGIHFTTKQYHKTKLLKILSNAKTSQHLYKKR
jgi:hypothetical protein